MREAVALETVPVLLTRSSRHHSIQQGLFQMVTNRILEDVQKVSGDVDRKSCVVGMTRLLAETPELLSTYAHVWPQLLMAIVKLLELPPEAASDDIGDIDPDLEGERMYLGGGLAFCFG